MNTISDIRHVFYINLDSRPDRKTHVESQLASIGITWAERFKAIELKNGAVGCSMSHLKCLEIAKSKNWDHLLILEDDITFLDPKVFVNQLNKFLSLQKDYDVLLVAGNNVSDYKKIGDYCVKVTKCQTTTGYLVKNHYFDTLIQNYKEGIQNLMKNQDKPGLFAIDQYWFKLQGQHKWYLIIPLTVTQREDYSNIEKRHTNYNHVMLDLDKPWLQRPPPVKYAPKLEIFPNP